MRRVIGTRNQEPIRQIGVRLGGTAWLGAAGRGRAIDAFIWRGSANPTPVQRVGAWIFGLLLLAQGSVIALQARRIGSVPTMVVACGAILFGARVFRNGFPRRKEP
jgi:hypothetical protein